MPSKFLPAVYQVRGDARIVESLGREGRRALLPHLLASIDALIQSIDSYYRTNRKAIGRRRLSKKEKTDEGIGEDRRHADFCDLVGRIAPVP